jgi:hypothetical protein
MASHDYIWETLYEGPGYFNYKVDPPLSIFPHTVEGSLSDISDDAYGDQAEHQYRVVNVSNGHQMLYYGGSSFGWNGADDYADPSSPSYDPLVKPLLYYDDFYGYKSFNLPAAWSYKNQFLSSIHAEADNCTKTAANNDTADCLPAGSIPTNMILKNRAWLAHQILAVTANADWKVPKVPELPSFDTSKPHAGYPRKACAGGKGVSFCDDFDAAPGTVASGLWQWQRNQSSCYGPQPWNTTFISSWRGVDYGAPQSGNGFAIVAPREITAGLASTITSKPVNVGTSGASLSFYFKGKVTTTSSSIKSDPANMTSGLFVDYTTDEGKHWTSLLNATSPTDAWARFTVADLPTASALQVRFGCRAPSPSGIFYCALDTVFIAAN